MSDQQPRTPGPEPPPASTRWQPGALPQNTQWQQQPTVIAPPGTVVPKSPGIAVIASLFLPGLGSMISGNVAIGVMILCLWLASWLLTVILIGFVGVFVFWVWGMAQAYRDAVSWNRHHGMIS